jgi:hypothetical protein
MIAKASAHSNGKRKRGKVFRRFMEARPYAGVLHEVSY